MNLSELQAECGRLLNDPGHSRWSTDILTARLNYSMTVVNGYTGAVKNSQTLTPTANTSVVPLTDSDVLDILRVYITRSNGDIERLEGISEEELDFLSPGWQNLDPGTPRNYFYRMRGQNIYLVPAPDSSNAVTNGLTVWFAEKPDDMSASSDTPFNAGQMERHGMSFVHWTVAQCWMDDGTPEALSKAKFHRSGMFERPGEFEKEIMRIREDFDNPTDVPSNIMWKPQGSRLNSRSRISKSAPLG